MIMIFSHLEFVSIHYDEITDIIIKKNRTRPRKRERDRLKEKFTKKNTDRYPGTRQLVLELSTSAHNDCI